MKKIKPEIQLMHKVWDGLKIENRHPTQLPDINFDEIISSIFAIGPFYYYLVDFFNLSISNISSGFKEAHGVHQDQIKTINDILGLIHPDDMDYVAKAEKKAYEFMYNSFGIDKITRFKVSYNFRFKTADGSYKMFNHQALILTVDENNNFVKALNIHTYIDNLTKVNNNTFSVIGLAGESSYLNIEVHNSVTGNTCSEKIFSKREVEIIKLLSEGYDTKSIGEKLFIAPYTVETHRKNILRKSGCKNSTELIARSMSEGWI